MRMEKETTNLTQFIMVLTRLSENPMDSKVLYRNFHSTLSYTSFPCQILYQQNLYLLVLFYFGHEKLLEQ